ncbi:MAG: exo-alpha-sialidase, partial [Lachnospiraceae bacterium]|nr:exo-alpha-sialidase [Lachnospiraceae bacterium]
LLYCEPHAVLLSDGRIVVQIRVESRSKPRTRFTLFQCESNDLGRTFSEPVRILGDMAGAPPHLLELSDGRVLSAFASRYGRNGIYAMTSTDGARTFSEPERIVPLGPDWDLGYPASAELDDGSILTVYYAHETECGPAVVKAVIWR